MKSVFNTDTTAESIQRIEALSIETQPRWGKMNAAQMLAHLNVAYDIAYDRIQVKNNALMRFLLKSMVKKMVVSEKPYKQNGPTSKAFLISSEKNFETEKKKLIENIKATEEKGEVYFEGKINQSFGKLTSKEWSNMFQKHMDHHFNQFGI